MTWPVWACVALLGASGSDVIAQVTPPAPRSNLQNTLPQPPSSAIEPRENVQRQPADEARASRRVAVREIRIAGVRSVPFSQVSALFKDQVGQEVDVRDLVQISRKIADLYHAHGFALSYGYLPVQDFDAGVVQVLVVEGWISSLELRDAPAFLQDRIRAVAQHIVGERPLTTRTFERYVSLLARLPELGVDANAPLPQNIDGATALQLAFRHRRITATAAFDADHPGFEGLLGLNVNGVTGLGDQLSVSVMAPRGELDRSYASVDYALPLGSDGLLLRANAYRYRAKPRPFFYSGFRLEQATGEDRAGIGLAYPLLLDAKRSVVAEVGAYASRSGDVYTEPPLPDVLDARASTRALQASVSGRWQQQSGQTQMDLQFVKGFNCCGAKQDVRLVDLDFSRVRLALTRSDAWANDSFGTTLSAVVQHTASWLPSPERITFGGSFYGNAYPSGESSGDSGWAVAGEIRKRFTREGVVRSIEPFLGVDHARTWLTGAASRPRPISSAIVGVRIATAERFNLSLGRAKPVGAPPAGESTRPWRWNVQFGVKF